MALSLGTCATLAAITPNATALESIKACQDAAETSYCYPPNGTRLCVPVDNVPFFWPKTYYAADSKQALEHNLNAFMTATPLHTHGQQTQNFTPEMYDEHAEPLPGVQGEKKLKLYIFERRFHSELPLSNLEVHRGPEVVLVKTREFEGEGEGSATRSAVGGLPTGRVSDVDVDVDGDGECEDKGDNPDHRCSAPSPGLNAGQIAGVVVGAIAALVATVLCVMMGHRFWTYRRNRDERVVDLNGDIEEVHAMRVSVLSPYLLGVGKQNGAGDEHGHGHVAPSDYKT